MDTVGQFLKTGHEGSGDHDCLQNPPPPPPVKGVSSHAATSPMASPKPSPPPTPRSEAGDVAMGKPDPPPLPEENRESGGGWKSLPFRTRIHRHHLVVPSEEDACKKRRAEPAPKVAKTEGCKAESSAPGNGRPLNHHLSLPADLKGYPPLVFLLPGKRVKPKQLHHFVAMSSPAFATSPPFGVGLISSFAKRISGLLRGYETQGTCNRTTR